MFETLTNTELRELRTRILTAFRLCHKLGSATAEFSGDVFNQFWNTSTDFADIHADLCDETQGRYSSIL